jgi:hypothetical protein
MGKAGGVICETANGGKRAKKCEQFGGSELTELQTPTVVEVGTDLRTTSVSATVGTYPTWLSYCDPYCVLMYRRSGNCDALVMSYIDLSIELFMPADNSNHIYRLDSINAQLIRDALDDCGMFPGF